MERLSLASRDLPGAKDLLAAALKCPQSSAQVQAHRSEAPSPVMGYQAGTPPHQQAALESRGTWRRGEANLAARGTCERPRRATVQWLHTGLWG